MTRATPDSPRGHQPPQKGHPGGTVLGSEHVDTEHLPVAVGVHAGGDDRGHAHHPAACSDLVEGGIQPDVGVGRSIEGPVAELGHLGIETLGQLGDLGLGHAVDAHRLDQVSDAVVVSSGTLRSGYGSYTTLADLTGRASGSLDAADRSET
jgi:hypothetical protein